MIMLGDVHGNWELLASVIKKFPSDNIFCLGEFGYWPKHDRFILPPVKNKVYFIDGNHEDFWSLRDNGYLDATSPQEIRENYFYVPRGIIVEIEEAKILCCGGGTSLDKAFRTIGETWFPEEEISYSDMQRCLKQLENNEVDYVFTHSAPSLFEIKKSINLLPFTSPSEILLNEIIEQVVKQEIPPFWFFSHYHAHAKNIYCDEVNKKYMPWRCLKIGETFGIGDSYVPNDIFKDKN